MEEPTPRQTTTLSGSASIGLNVGSVVGGLQIGHLGDVQVVADSQFFELKQEEVHTERWPDPPPVNRLIDLLAEHRLLILAGPLDDKAEFARHLAFRLRQRLAGEYTAEVSVRERWRGKDPQRIEAAFQGGGTTVLLLPEISKSQIAGYGPAKLRELLRDRNGYAIVTTECSRMQWDIGDDSFEARLWQELSWETHYGRAELASYLEDLLFSSDLPVPEGLLPDGTDSTLLIEGVPLAIAVEKLKSPERVRYFAESLLKGHTPPSRQAIESRLAELAGDASAIRQWYDQFEPRDQLLAVGLVLLDGLPENLLFAGLEILVETTWRGTDPLLAQFDYRDLSRFAGYFKETRVDGGLVRIESGSRERRRQILGVAWQHQRRRLLATLPALTQMIRASATQPDVPPTVAVNTAAAAPEPAVHETVTVAGSATRALGRTESGSLQLHQVLLESLSLIGLLSIEVVEPYLLDLAADPSESVQQLVAGALAAWREQGNDGKLFDLLRRWWSEACDVGGDTSRIARAARLGPDPGAAVRAAVALAVGYAAQYDREDHLVPPLCDLLEVLLMDSHPRVRGVVSRITLPRAVAWHFRQLEPLLRTRALAVTGFIEAVARGAAAACELRPEVCLPILETWRTLARAETEGSKGRPGIRKEVLLGTVALTYGFIRCDEQQPRLSPAVVLGKLRTLLADESHPVVRHYAFYAVEIQTQRDFGLAAQLLQALLARVTLADRPAVVELAVRTYLHQRQQLAGGDRRVEAAGRNYAVWIESARPLTGFEASLYSWILDDTRPVAQQLAVDIFAALSDTALDREERRLLQVRPRTAETRGGGGPAVAPRPAAAEVHSLAPLGHLAVLLAAPRKPQLRPILKPLLAELIVERRRGPAPHGASAVTAAAGSVPTGPTGKERIETLLARWHGVRNSATNAIAAYLGRALAFYRWRWAMVLVMALLLFGTYRLGRASWTAWTRHRAAVAGPVQPPPNGDPIDTAGPSAATARDAPR